MSQLEAALNQMAADGYDIDTCEQIDANDILSSEQHLLLIGYACEDEAEDEPPAPG